MRRVAPRRNVPKASRAKPAGLPADRQGLHDVEAEQVQVWLQLAQEQSPERGGRFGATASWWGG